MFIKEPYIVDSDGVGTKRKVIKTHNKLPIMPPLIHKLAFKDQWWLQKVLKICIYCTATTFRY